MGQCLDKLPHQCGTDKGLQVFDAEDGTVNGYCFACDTFVRHPYGKVRDIKDIPKPKLKTKEQIDAEIEEVASYKTMNLASRKLKKEWLEHFDVKISVSEEDGKTPAQRYYPYTRDGVLVGYRVKSCSSKFMYTIGDVKECDFFGWDQAIKTGSNRLIVTEGEDDAVACKQILERCTPDAYRDRMPAVVSITTGSASAANDFARLSPKIRQHFKEVVLAFDQDDAGQKATQAVLTIFPGAIVATLPSKDANQAILDGAHKAFYDAVQWNAGDIKNTSLILGDDLYEKAKEPPKYGEISWPWDHLNKITRGIFYGKTYYLGAGVKMGKSEILNTLAAHFVKNDIKIFMAKPEEANVKTYKLIAGKLVGRRFHDPDVEFDYEAFDRASDIMKGKISMINLYQHLGWSSLRQDIIAAHAWGAKVVFIDPITNLTNGISSDKANTILQDIAQDLAALAMDLDVAIFIFCHLKAPEGNLNKDVRLKKYDSGIYYGLGNCPHELGGDVLSNQFAGSRAMMRSCNYMIGIEGNKDSNLDEEKRNVRNLKLLEDREFGESGDFRIRWNRETTLFAEL